MSESSSSGGGCGCITIVVTCLFFWALIFGVTVGGKHYGLSCSTEHGVQVTP